MVAELVLCLKVVMESVVLIIMFAYVCVLPLLLVQLLTFGHREYLIDYI